MSYIFNRSFPILAYVAYVTTIISAPWCKKPALNKHLIAPVFVIEGKQQRQAVVNMPGVERLSVDLLIEYAKQLLSLGVTTIDLFPVISPNLKSLQAEHAYDENGLACTAIKAIKDALPEMVVMTDVALDPYTSHGQDGIVDDNGYVLNDITVDILAKQALSHARAGADIISPKRYDGWSYCRASSSIGWRKFY